MTHATALPLLTPPRPVPAKVPMSTLKLGLTLGRNVLAVWGEEAYRRDILVGPLFGVTSFTLNEPEAIRHVFIDNHDNYARTLPTRRMLTPIIGQGLFMSEGAAWRRQRRALAPAFTPRAIDPLRAIMAEVAVEKLEALGSRVGRPVDLFAFTQRLALNIAGRTMFSLEMASHAPRMRSMIEDYATKVGPSLFDLALPEGWPNPSDIRRGLSARRWMRFIEELMEEREAQGAAPDTPRDLYDLLLASRDPEDGSAFDRTQLRDQVATMILAGHETTATSLFWSFLLLALAPEIQEQAAAEAAGWTDDGSALAGQLPLINAVASEALRLYPPAFLVTRVAKEADRIGPHKVKPGDIVSASPWLLQRHEKLWRDPHSFDPGRFMPGAPPIDRFAYLPFGIGPRICIGAHFAQTEMIVVIAEALKRFRFERTDDRPVLPVGVVTLRPDHSARFRLSVRQRS